MAQQWSNKPAADTLLDGLALAKFAEDVGMPLNVIDVVPAPHDKSAEIGGALTSSHDVRVISLTDSSVLVGYLWSSW